MTAEAEPIGGRSQGQEPQRLDTSLGHRSGRRGGARRGLASMRCSRRQTSRIASFRTAASRPGKARSLSRSSWLPRLPRLRAVIDTCASAEKIWREQPFMAGIDSHSTALRQSANPPCERSVLSGPNRGRRLSRRAPPMRRRGGVRCTVHGGWAPTLIDIHKPVLISFLI